MARRIDYAAQVGEIFGSVDFGQAEVTKYLGKDDKNKHMFEIKFNETKNINIVSWNQLRVGKFRDTELLKQIKIKHTTEKLKHRNRRTKTHKSKYSTNDINTKYTLMLDWSTFNTGISLWEKEKHLISKSYSSESKCFRTRSNEISNNVCSILDYCNDDVTVFIEDIYLGLNSTVLCVLSESRGYITKEFIKRNIRFELIPATKVRHDMNAPKHREDIKKWAVDFYEKQTGLIAEDDDLADAFVTGYWLNVLKLEK